MWDGGWEWVGRERGVGEIGERSVRGAGYARATLACGCVCAALLVFPVLFIGGWIVRQRSYDKAIENAYVEARVQEELTGKLTPVELDPRKRASMEKERLEILAKLRVIEERRALVQEAEERHSRRP
jgi:hypothetical protein